MSLDDLAAQVRARSDQRHWREEVSLRVDRHRARRRHSDDEASLRLDFPEGEALLVNSGPALWRRPGLPQSVAQSPIASDNDSLKEQRVQNRRAGKAQGNEAPLDETVARPQARKIIRFPKYVTEDVRPAPAPLITEIELAEPVAELAEPVTDARRAMEARPAEQMELLPSFTEIRLDESPSQDYLAGELELPLYPAALGRRAFSAVLDLGLVLLSLAIFSFSFSRITPAATMVPARTELLSGAVTGVILWFLFQYMFLVYSKATPGMRAARLKLVAFDGECVSLFARRSRALASALSAVSVGLGFAWALIDEDTLGWQDRISRTYLRSK